MSLNAVAHELVCVARRRKWIVHSGGRHIVFEFATALRCFAKRYVSCPPEGRGMRDGLILAIEADKCGRRW
jgi:hypothetical protein